MTIQEKKIKYSIIGTGKTGGTIAQHLGNKAVPFDEYNRPTTEKLKKTDIAIIFVPGSAAAEVIETVLKANIPAIWGTTGYAWPADLPQRVKEVDARWIIGSNFSLGMNLVRKAIQILGKGSGLLVNPEFHIHEIHHVQKQDEPSGTALSWRDWLGQNASISSDRQGDVIGIHNLHIKTPGESVYLKHEAHTRNIFAHGAIWAANYLLANPYIDAGVYQFQDIFDQAFKELA
jgi:4-hydroxy-tetrahydrodipicolinate reductase